MDYRFESLSRDRFPQIHRTFAEAFADYYVDASGVTETMLLSRAVKNGVDFGSSAGAFCGDRMVGITIVGLDDWKGSKAAFDIATGIVPGHRGRGLAGRMFAFVLPGLRELGVERFVLEVIQENEPAIKAYEAAGFRATREFDCFQWKLDKTTTAAQHRAFDIRTVSRDLLAEFEPHLDWHPSWENSFAAIRRIPDEVISYGAFEGGVSIGLIVYYPTTNWITTLVVKKEYRRNGAASALLAHFARERPGGVEVVKLVNVDHSDAATLGLLEKIGVEPLVRQFEMEREL